MRHRLRRNSLLVAAVGAWLSSVPIPGCTGEDESRPNILLLSLDTLRADHLGAYGYERDTSPVFDRLARESVLFEHAIAQHPYTLPSHRSLFQSRYAFEEDKPYLAELLWARGYRTVALTGGGYLAASFGFDRGFDRYEQHPAGLRALLPIVRRWMAESPGGPEPFFLFLHTYDIHTPYQPSHPFRELYTRKGYQGPVLPELTARLQTDYLGLTPASRASLEVEWNEEDRHQFEALYDGGIREADARLGELLRILDEAGRWDWDRDVLAIVSDHGEEFWDHDSIGHGSTLYEEVIRVPMLLRLPGGAHGGRRVRGTVELMDLAPTLLELARVSSPTSYQGTSLLTLLRAGEEVEPHAGAAMSRTTTGWASLARWPWKLLLHPETGERVLFQLEEDPHEKHPVTDDPPEIARAMLEQLMMDARVAAASEAQQEPTRIEDPELIRQLEALGYVTAGPRD